MCVQITPDAEEEKHIVDVVNTDVKEEWVGSIEEKSTMDEVCVRG